MDVAYSLVRQCRVTAQDLFDKHSDPFRTMGRELVCCCECRQPVMLRGSLGGRMRPHFAHYKLTNGKIEDAVPCDSRVTGGSREYIKGEQKKHKTYGLGYLFRRLELYQSLALLRTQGDFGFQGLYLRAAVPTGIGELDVVQDFSAVSSLSASKGGDLGLVFKLAKLPDEASDDPAEQERTRIFMASQTLFRARLGTTVYPWSMGEYLSRNFYREGASDYYWADYWSIVQQVFMSAAREAETPEVELFAIEKSKSAEIAYDLHRYLSTRAAERHRLSLLFSLCTPLAAEALTLHRDAVAPAKSSFTEAEMRSVAIDYALKAAASCDAEESKDARRHAQMYLALRFIVDTFRYAAGLAPTMGANGVPTFDIHLFAALEKRYRYHDGDFLDHQKLNKVLTLLSNEGPDSFAETLAYFPYSSVFEDVLYRPEEIEKHYRFTNSDDGFIYLGHDPALDQIWHKPSVKVGKSIDPERRGRQLAGQCLPRPLRIHRVWYVSDMRRAEQLVFQNLQRKRARGNREIFHLQVAEAAGRIDGILRRSNLLEVG